MDVVYCVRKPVFCREHPASVSVHMGLVLVFQEVAAVKPPPRRARTERVTMKEEPEQDSPSSPSEEREVRELEVRKECKKEKKEDSRDVKEKKEPKEKKDVKPLEAVCKQEEIMDKVQQ